VDKPIIRRESAVDGCARLLEDAIVEGELSPGEKLLPERELASQLGVNRVTIRSALERLAVGRLLEARQGSGHRVRDYRRHAGPRLIHALLRVGSAKKRTKRLREMARDLLLLRRTILGLAIERASEVASGGDRRRLSDAVERFVTTTDPTHLPEAERIVIDSILDAARSPVLSFALNPILAVIEELPELQEAMAEDPWGNVDAYRAVVTGLERPEKKWRDNVLAELGRRDLMVLSRLSRR
jgi:DNA-binding FadR family transcriptional regulator